MKEGIHGFAKPNQMAQPSDLNLIGGPMPRILRTWVSRLNENPDSLQPLLAALCASSSPSIGRQASCYTIILADSRTGHIVLEISQKGDKTLHTVVSDS